MKNLHVNFEVHAEDQPNWHKLKHFIDKKYGKLNGVIGKELINLAILGMEKSPDTHTQKHLTRTVNHRYADLLSFLSQFNDIDEPTLKTQIGDCIGQDLRTYKKYNEILVSRSILSYYQTIGNKRIKIYNVNLAKVRRELKRLKGAD